MKLEIASIRPMYDIGFERVAVKFEGIAKNAHNYEDCVSVEVNIFKSKEEFFALTMGQVEALAIGEAKKVLTTII